MKWPWQKERNPWTVPAPGPEASREQIMEFAVFAGLSDTRIHQFHFKRTAIVYMAKWHPDVTMPPLGPAPWDK